MGTPHKHAELIKAWAEDTSLTFQCRPPLGEWVGCHDLPPLWSSKMEYRIKPEPKPDYIIKRLVECSGAGGLDAWLSAKPNVQLTFDGETKKLKKVEMIDE